MIPSASGLPRAFRCRASMLLPQVHRASSAAAHKGTQVHRFLEEVPALGRDAALLNVTDESARALCEALDLERLPLGDGVSWASEVAYSYDIHKGTAREVGRGIGRAYPEDGGLHGTADLVSLADDGDTAIVLDVKTGHGWLPEAGESEQLKFLALAACRAHGASRARIGHLHLRDDGTPWTDWAELDAFDLDAFASSLRMLAATTTGQPVEGGWCRYCPAFAACPAKNKLAVSLGGGLSAADISVALTPETAAKAWERITLARQVLAEAERKVEEYAREHPLTLSNGLVLGPVEDEKDEIDDERAAGLLRKSYEQAALAVTPTVTKKGIDKLARHLREQRGGTIKDAKEEVFELLRKHGALTVKRRTVVKEYRPL
jgi:hypothetical protein